jgi:hypothetical protein
MFNDMQTSRDLNADFRAHLDRTTMAEDASSAEG